MESLRIVFARELYSAMEKHPGIILLTGDLGYGIFDRIRAKFPDRFFNCQASEQAMTGAAIGMALSGKIPFVYSITPFLLARPFEAIRNYINNESIPVKLVGSGRDWDYEHDGFSHYAGDDLDILLNFKNIETFRPDTQEGIGELIETVVYCGRPCYINLSR